MAVPAVAASAGQAQVTITQLGSSTRERFRQRCGPHWTSDGKTVFFRSDIDWSGGNPDAKQEVFRMNVDGTNKVQMTSNAGGFGSTAWAITPG